jgi:D-glycerate 3-kinase
MLERAPAGWRSRRADLLVEHFPAAMVAATADAVVERLRARRRPDPLFVGLSGLPGSGKSTLARQLCEVLAGRGHPSLVLALDDFYLGRRERSRLAREVHPLFATRGPAGTHDIVRLLDVLDALRRSRTGIRLPRFDRLRDRRLPPSRWRTPRDRPEVVILEGWLVGVPPLSSRELLRAPNALERHEDAGADWRRAVNDALGSGYARVWRRLDLLVALLAPDLDAMRRWRGEAERAMARTRGVRGMTRSGLRRFLEHYERWAAHALRVLPGRADIAWRLDRRHGPIRCAPADSRAGRPR